MDALTYLAFALVYSFIGAAIGIAYSHSTCADLLQFRSIVGLSMIYGPVILLTIVGVRKAALESGIPAARRIFHTKIMASAVPVLCFLLLYLSRTFGTSKVSLAFEVFIFWSIPAVFVTSVMLYLIWRVFRRDVGSSVAHSDVTKTRG